MVFIEVETDEGITGLGESLLSHANDIAEALHADTFSPGKMHEKKSAVKPPVWPNLQLHA